jgi:hypothetical protein
MPVTCGAGGAATPEPSDTFPFTVPLLRSMAPDFTTTVTLLWVIAEE